MIVWLTTAEPDRFCFRITARALGVEESAISYNPAYNDIVAQWAIRQINKRRKAERARKAI